MEFREEPNTVGGTFEALAAGIHVGSDQIESGRGRDRREPDENLHQQERNEATHEPEYQQMGGWTTKENEKKKNRRMGCVWRYGDSILSSRETRSSKADQDASKLVDI